MIYLLAVFLSLIACGQGFAAEVTAGNIGHVRNGRLPNAGAAIFPVIPLVQLFAIGGTWLLQLLIAHLAVWVILGYFLASTTVWAVRFVKFRAELDRVTAASNTQE